VTFLTTKNKYRQQQTIPTTMPTNLLDLPDELLVHIVRRLHDYYPIPQPRDFNDWPYHEDYVASSEFHQNYLLTSLPLTCRRLRTIVTPILYAHVSLWLPRNPYDEDVDNARLDLFTRFHGRSVHSMSSRSVKSITGVKIEATADLLPFLLLPNIHTLVIDSLGGLEFTARLNPARGLSNVTTLRISNCRASVDTLNHLLQCPRALTEFAIQWDEYDTQESHIEAVHSVLFDTVPLMRACQLQAATLQTMTITRIDRYDILEGYSPGPQADFTPFPVLQHLKVDYYILVGNTLRIVVHEALPDSLRTLDVYCDVYHIFSPRYPETFSHWQTWLKAMARSKRTRLPNLTTVNILADNLCPLLEPQSQMSEAEARKEFEETRMELQTDFASVGVLFTAETLDKSCWQEFSEFQVHDYGLNPESDEFRQIASLLARLAPAPSTNIA